MGGSKSVLRLEFRAKRSEITISIFVTREGDENNVEKRIHVETIRDQHALASSADIDNKDFGRRESGSACVK